MIWAHRELPPWALRAVRRAAWRSALIVFVAADERPIGGLLLADELRAETPHAIRMLRGAGVARVIVLTGDRSAGAEIIGAALDFDSQYSLTGLQRTKSMRCAPNSRSARPLWLVMESMTPRRWLRPM